MYEGIKVWSISHGGGFRCTECDRVFGSDEAFVSHRARRRGIKRPKPRRVIRSEETGDLIAEPRELCHDPHYLRFQQDNNGIWRRRTVTRGQPRVSE